MLNEVQTDLFAFDFTYSPALEPSRTWARAKSHLDAFFSI